MIHPGLPSTHFTIEHFRQMAGIPPHVFYDLDMSNCKELKLPTSDKCDDRWTMYPDNFAGSLSLIELAETISAAEIAIQNFLGYSVGSEWVTEQVNYPQGQQAIRGVGKTLSGYANGYGEYKAVQARENRATQFGARRMELLSTETVTLVDDDGDTFTETVEFSLVLEHRDRAKQVRIYWAGSDKREPKNEITYLTDYLFNWDEDTLTATWKLPLFFFVDPDLRKISGFDFGTSNAIAICDATGDIQNLVTEFDIYSETIDVDHGSSFLLTEVCYCDSACSVCSDKKQQAGVTSISGVCNMGQPRPVRLIEVDEQSTVAVSSITVNSFDSTEYTLEIDFGTNADAVSIWTALTNEQSVYIATDTELWIHGPMVTVYDVAPTGTTLQIIDWNAGECSDPAKAGRDWLMDELDDGETTFAISEDIAIYSNKWVHKTSDSSCGCGTPKAIEITYLATNDNKYNQAHGGTWNRFDPGVYRRAIFALTCAWLPKRICACQAGAKELIKSYSLPGSDNGVGILHIKDTTKFGFFASNALTGEILAWNAVRNFKRHCTTWA